MTDRDNPSNGSIDPTEVRLRGRLRVIAGFAILVVLVVMSLAETFGRDAGFHAPETIFGGLLGALLLILGVEAPARLGGGGKK